METHSTILAWEVLWTKETGGLQSMGSDMTERLRERERERQAERVKEINLIKESKSYVYIF